MHMLAALLSDDPAWPLIADLIAASPYPVEVLPADPARADEELLRLQVTTRSWLGSVVHETGGLLIDHGWLRVFGSGDATRGLSSLGDVNGQEVGVVVAHDVLGGQFDWRPPIGGGRPTVHYFAPDSLTWDDLEMGYGDWLTAMLGGALTGFAEALRWPGWPEEVAACRLDWGINLLPPPWTREGKDMTRVSRKAMPISELLP